MKLNMPLGDIEESKEDAYTPIRGDAGKTPPGISTANFGVATVSQNFNNTYAEPSRSVDRVAGFKPDDAQKLPAEQTPEPTQSGVSG